MAILYCHWLQLRWRALFAIAMTFLLGIGVWSRLRAGIEVLERTGRLPGRLPDYAESMQHLSAPSILVWSLLVDHAWTIFWMGPFALAIGTTTALTCAYQPDYFSRSLPVSRFRWICTRFAMNGAILFLTACITTAIAGMWLTQQYEVPWQPVVFSIGVGCLGILPWFAATEVVNSIATSTKGLAIATGAGFVPYLIFTTWLLQLSHRATIDSRIVVNLGIFAVVGSAAMLALAVWAARKMEY